MRSLLMREDCHNSNDGIRLLEMPQQNRTMGTLQFLIFAPLWGLTYRFEISITPTQLQWLKTYSRRGISIDDTHNATKYPMKLATVVVADDLDRGFPAGMLPFTSFQRKKFLCSAFLLSGTMTAADVQKLFMEIKKLLPEFNPKYIVTDEAPCFFNGYKAVFPLSSTQLRYCRWHVSKTWSEL